MSITQYMTDYTTDKKMNQLSQLSSEFFLYKNYITHHIHIFGNLFFISQSYLCD